MLTFARQLICLIGSVSCSYGTSLILGDTSGNTRGAYAIDISSHRINAFNVASGAYSISVGNYNEAWGDYSILFGSNNSSEGSGYAFGSSNSIFASGPFDEPGGAYGYGNVIDSGGMNSFAFGANNYIPVEAATVFGNGIENQIEYSTMIGPSDAAKVTIRSSGNVGIGTTSPTEKLEVAGNIKLSGNIVTSTGTLSLPNGSATVLTNSGIQTITGEIIVLGTTTLGASTPTQQIKIDGTTGNLGIGTAAPSAKLDVNGTVQIAGDVKVKNNAVIRVSPAGDVSMGDFTSGANPQL